VVWDGNELSGTPTEIIRSASATSAGILTTGAQEIAGAKDFKGDMILSGQTAGSATNAMNRGLVEGSIAAAGGILAVTLEQARGLSHSGLSTPSTGADGIAFSVTGGSASGVYQRDAAWLPFLNTSNTLTFSGSVPLGFQVSWASGLTGDEPNARLRFLAGENNLDATALNAAGWGFEVERIDSSTTRYRCVAHNGTTLTEGDWVTINPSSGWDTNWRIFDCRLDNGTVTLRRANVTSAQAPAWSAVATCTGGPTSGNSGGAYLLSILQATDTTTNTSAVTLGWHQLFYKVAQP
jgi:hypothetical protein